MGIIRKQDTTLIRLFKGSRTYQNVLAENFLVVNITNDPVAFVRYTFSEVQPEDIENISSPGREFPVLKAAQSWIAFECINTKITSEALVQPKAPNRGLNAVIEATIHATRYKMNEEEKYMKLIDFYEDIINKCGGEREKEAIRLLHTFL